MKHIAFSLFLLLSLAANSQQQPEAPIQKEYIAPDAETIDENPTKRYLMGSGAALIVIIAFAVRRRKRRNRMRENFKR